MSALSRYFRKWSSVEGDGLPVHDWFWCSYDGVCFHNVFALGILVLGTKHVLYLN